MALADRESSIAFPTPSMRVNRLRVEISAGLAIHLVFVIFAPESAVLAEAFGRGHGGRHGAAR